MATKVEDLTTLDKLKNVYANDGPKLQFLAVWIGANIYLFFDTFVALRTGLAYEVLGEWLPVAKGMGAVLRFNCALILFPVMRTFLRALRETFINDLMPIDMAISFHKRVAYVIALATGVHTLCHLYNFSNLAEVPTLEALQEALVANPPEIFSATEWLLFSVPGFTGVLLIIVMLLMYGSAHESVRRPYFETFWYTHHLFIAFYILGMVHGAGGFVGPPAFWVWTGIPLILYLFERFLRYMRGVQNTVLVGAIAHPSNVIELRFQKAQFNYKSGMYLFVNCPYIYLHEWHPFTITSCPSDPYVSVHIRMVGDWTKALGQLLLKSQYREQILETSMIDGMPIIRIDGPFGAASDQVYNFENVVLVGAGIGVTPFASILKDIRHKITSRANIPTKRVHFFWISRDKAAFEWFQETISDMERVTGKDFLEINIYLTGGLPVDDIRTIVYDDSQADIVTGLEAGTQFGRPNWDRIFRRLATEHEGERIGVFFCGPRVLSRTLNLMSRRYTSPIPGSTSFRFSKENF